jgi:hypothetical protein
MSCAWCKKSVPGSGAFACVQCDLLVCNQCAEGTECGSCDNFMCPDHCAKQVMSRRYCTECCAQCKDCETAIPEEAQQYGCSHCDLNVCEECYRRCSADCGNIFCDDCTTHDIGSFVCDNCNVEYCVYCAKSPLVHTCGSMEECPLADERGKICAGCTDLQFIDGYCPTCVQEVSREDGGNPDDTLKEEAALSASDELVDARPPTRTRSQAKKNRKWDYD